MKILLDDVSMSGSLYPFGIVRSIAHCRIGILSIFEKWNFYFPDKVSIASECGNDLRNTKAFISFPANVIPSHDFLRKISAGDLSFPDDSCRTLSRPWHFFLLNDWAIRQDFEMITAGRESADLPANNYVQNASSIFIEPGAQVNCSMINASAGPVYIGKGAEIMEGCMIRGPFAMGENAVLKMGTRLYGATTIGPHCIAGGEIKNSILMANSNKAHDGYLGDSVIGEWCNLGAGTSNSNLKNTVSPVRVWYEPAAAFEEVGIKSGLLMGDYSRSAINTAFNTGTVVGICCHIFGGNEFAKHVESFTWGNEEYRLEKAIADINNWKKLKGHTLTEAEKQKLEALHQKK